MRFEPGRHPGFDNSPRPRPHDNRFGDRHRTNNRPDARPNPRSNRPNDRISRPVENRPPVRPNIQTRPSNSQPRMGSGGSVSRPSGPSTRQSGGSGNGRFSGRR